ncbi:MAG: glycosyltransferase family 4 protein [Chlorobi bacterium]|nr:glycosyltransferase family 4 protein [Chlorobiota bacterium]
MKTKITYILSNIDKALTFEWIVHKLDEEKFELSFLLLNNKGTNIELFLKEKKIYVKQIYLKSKKDYPKAFLIILKELKKIKPNIIHTHLRDANILGLLTAKFLGIKKRIYTRHHSTFHHDNFPKAVKLDKIINSLATDIIAISENVKNVLIEKERVNKDKIHLIHHGFDLDAFENVEKIEVEALNNKYISNEKYPIIGVIARYINWKGHKYQIKAFKQILKKYPSAFFIFANTNGPNKNEIQELLKNNLSDKSYVEIEFENNLFALYKLFDIYVHTPINKEIEAFGQTYVEALASGISSVFTLSGIANEFVTDKENALVVDYCNSEQIYNAIIELLENQNLQNKLVQNGKKGIKQFNLDLFINKLENLYE